MTGGLQFQLHQKQQEIFFSPARFKVVTAGRRGGKSYLAAIIMVVEGLKDTAPNGRPLTDVNQVWYVAPTYGQARDIMWKQLKKLAEPVTKAVKEKDLTIILVNDREIVLKGSDREDTLRGVGLGYLVMDEYADMKPDVFDLILRATLMDFEAGCLFIGTPKGKNHFYHLWVEANKGTDPEWEAFHFTSHDNPMVTAKELRSITKNLSKAALKQEIGASFLAQSGGAIKEEDIIIVDKAPLATGTVYIAVDPNGFKNTEGLSKNKLALLDETSIAVVLVAPDGWYVLDMIHGRWGIRETSLQIIRAAQKYRPAALGVENLDVIKPYLVDQMKRLSIYPTLMPLKHHGQNKTARVLWALQGRFENHRIKFVRGDWNQWMTDQCLAFPEPLTHDDGPDSLAYIDQVGTTVFGDQFEIDEWFPIDDVAGL